jgi:hypothetical protein
VLPPLDDLNEILAGLDRFHGQWRSFGAPLHRSNPLDCRRRHATPWRLEWFKLRKPVAASRRSRRSKVGFMIPDRLCFMPNRWPTSCDMTYPWSTETDWPPLSASALKAGRAGGERTRRRSISWRNSYYRKFSTSIRSSVMCSVCRARTYNSPGGKQNAAALVRGRANLPSVSILPEPKGSRLMVPGSSIVTK